MTQNLFKRFAFATLCFTSVTGFASTCPTHFMITKDGYLASKDKPGWRSHNKVKPNTTVSSNRFGGAIFSPKYKRIICVYQTDKKRWIAMLSNPKHAFSQDDIDSDEWNYSAKHGDFVCKNKSRSVDDCEFDTD